MASVLMRNDRGECRLYVDGACVGSWDKHDLEGHIWRQVAQKTSDDEVEEVFAEGPLPAKLETKPKRKAAPKKKPSEEAERVVVEDDTPRGPMTSYTTGNGSVESL